MKGHYISTILLLQMNLTSPDFVLLQTFDHSMRFWPLLGINFLFPDVTILTFCEMKV